jgi:hypothetical protein
MSNAQVAKHCRVGGPLVASLKAIFLEQKAAARRKAEQAEAALAQPPDEEPGASAEDDFIEVKDPEAPAQDDEDKIEQNDLEQVRERGYRALRKASRFAYALGLSIEAFIRQWRADGQDTLLRDQQKQLEALAREEAAEREEAEARKRRSPWDDD